MATSPKGFPTRIARQASNLKSAFKLTLVATSAAFTTKHRSPVAAAQAKTHLLALIAQVELDRTPIVITRRRRPIVQIVPMQEEVKSDIFGCMKGTGRITGDIVGPEPDVWEATSE